MGGSGLDTLLERCLSSLKANLASSATFVNPSREVAVALSMPSPRIEIIPVEKRILEMDGVDMFRNNKKPAHYRLEMMSRIRGVHVPIDGKIYLHRGNWCIETVIHELLHACSVLSLVDQVDDRFTDFNEGLTEFLTGYILYKQFPDAYQKCWRAPDDRQCKMTYVPSTRLWGAFCHFVPIREVLPIYLHSGSADYATLIAQFTHRIRKLGHKKFESPLGRGTMPVFERFKSICKNTFPSFDSIYSSHEKCTDFAQLEF